MLAALVLGAAGLSAKIYIMVDPVDSLSRFTLPPDNVDLMLFARGDSVALGQTGTAQFHTGVRPELRQFISIEAPAEPREYTLILDAEGYLGRTVPLTIGPKTPEWYDLKEIGLMRRPRELDEVEVTATKIKLFYRGDTLVYNADAFMLPQGSMLDDLIKQLPGVRLTEAGEIFCNGRKIQSLQLDGRKLFDGDPSVLLKNLGAYAVKHIKVYEQTDVRAALLGYDDPSTREYVMDVNLKKRYAIGHWLNFDAGAGTGSRWLGRAFYLGFTKTAALSAYVNANNINTDGESYQYQADWRPNQSGTDRDARYINGGISYQADPKRALRKVNGSVKAQTSSVNAAEGERSVTYLDGGGDRYGYRAASSVDRTVDLSTKHQAYLVLGRADLRISPDANWRHTSDNGLSAAATLSRMADAALGYDDIAALYGTGYDSLRRYIVNRELRRYRNRRNSYSTHLGLSSAIRLPDIGGTKQNIQLGADGRLNGSSSRNFSDRAVNYGPDPVPGYAKNEYVRVSPAYNRSIGGSLRYELRPYGGHYFALTYSYTRSWERTHEGRYLLSNLDETAAEALPFGQAPDDPLLAEVYDRANSYRSKYDGCDNSIQARAVFNWGEPIKTADTPSGKLTLTLQPQARFLTRRLHYAKGTADTLAVRHLFLPALPALTLNWELQDRQADRYWTAQAGFDSKTALFGMTQIIDIPDTNNPLYITRGNPGLKNSRTNTLTLQSALARRKAGYTNYGFSLSAYRIHDDIAHGTVYDPVTGIRTTTYYNVDGTRGANGRLYANLPVKTFRNGLRITFNGGLNGSLRRSAGLLATEGSDPWLRPEAFNAHNITYGGNATLQFTLYSRFDATLRVNTDHHRYTSDRPDYLPFTNHHWSYGADLGYKLLKAVWLNTSLTNDTHTGYTDPSLNRSQLVWNAGASWLWAKPRLTIRVDAYDILRQVRSTAVYADNFGRTEIWRNTLPRFILLHVSYTLDVSLK